MALNAVGTQTYSQHISHFARWCVLYDTKKGQIKLLCSLIIVVRRQCYTALVLCSGEKIFHKFSLQSVLL